MPDLIEFLLAEWPLILGMAAIVVFFAVNWWREPALRRRIEAQDPRAKLDAYASLMIHLWGLAGLVVGAWFVSGRDLASLGLSAPALTVWGWGSWLVTGLCAAYLLYTIAQTALSSTTRDTLRKQFEQSGDYALIQPKQGREYRRFYGVAVTAGVTEEIIFRGFLIGALALILPAWVAAGLALMVFVIGHSYQGVSGMVRILPISLVLTGLYLASGSLWPGIALHILVDLTGGAIFHLTGASPSSAEPEAAG